MEKETQDLLTQFLGKLKTKEQLNELSSELFRQGIQTLLQAELEAHLGYKNRGKLLTENKRNGYSMKTIKGSNGEYEIAIPRDRNSTFDPVTVPKHSSVTEDLENAIILLYAKGMSNADIIEFIEREPMV